VLSQPEFSSSEKLLDLMEAVDERNLAKAIPAESVGERRDGDHRRGEPERSDARVQHRHHQLRHAGGHKGTIAVLGPTRMHYPRAIATVRYMGDDERCVDEAV
jgi:transcriptional regulator of heat shock response